MELTPTEVFTANNNQLAVKLRTLVEKSVDKATDMIVNAERPDQVYTAIKIAEIAGKITGIVQEKQQLNVQINQITGFTFIEASKPTTLDQKDSVVVEETKQII